MPNEREMICEIPMPLQSAAMVVDDTSSRDTIAGAVRESSVFAYYSDLPLEPSLRSTAPRRFDIGDLLALGFGTTVAIWAAGYITRLPGYEAPPLVLFSLIILAFASGGFLAGRYTVRGAIAGLYTGLISAGLNLILFNSLFIDDASGQPRPHWQLGLLGFIAAAGILGWIGGFIGSGSHARSTSNQIAPNWKSALAAVAFAAACVLILAGGLVTAFHAGLAVPDWPTSFGFNMFLFPVAKMTGGVYYEHFHRLIASYLGLTLTVIAVYLLIFDRRRWMKFFGVGLFFAIVVQGAIGGLRVTMKDTDLALLHGIVAQLIFATLALGIVFTTRRFEFGPPAISDDTASFDRTASGLLVIALMGQLVLGAFVRHRYEGTLFHISFAGIVALLTLVVGLRLTVARAKIPVLRRFGIALLALVVIQLLAGIIALIVRPPIDAPRNLAQALATTLHQTNGALLLASAACTAAWTRRVLKP
jgi:cytochrome c oxidase assembly protein subunit 15